MSEENKQTDHISKDRFTVENISLVQNRDEPTIIDKIKILTNKGIVTNKPKIKDVEYIGGFATEVIRPMTVNDIPEYLKEMNNIIRSTGKLYVCGSYEVMTVTEPNETKIFKFVQGDGLKNWIYSSDLQLLEESLKPVPAVGGVTIPQAEELFKSSDLDLPPDVTNLS